MPENIYENGAYLRRNPDWGEAEAPWKAEQIRTMIARHRLAPATVADIGCGCGAILACLQPHLPVTCELTGYDISPQAIELCRTRANDRLRFQQADFTVETGARVDLALVIDVIEHLEDYFSFLRALRVRCASAFFHIPLELSAQMALRGSPFLRTREQFGHLHQFNREIALRILTETGFEVVDDVYTAWATDLPAISWRSRLARLPRKLLYRLSPHFTAHLLGGYSLLVLAR